MERKMEKLTSQERLNRICKILIKGIYLYARKQGWFEEGATNKDNAKDMIMVRRNKKAEIACFSLYLKGQE